MLRVLKMKNLAIFADAEIDFSKEMNVITGETGSGKSITLSAIELLKGARASSDLIRHNEKSCEIEGLFEINKDTLSQDLLEILEAFDGVLEDGELVIRRQISLSGKSKAYINGKLVSASELRNISSFLIEFTSQHAQLGLLDKKSYQNLLDSFAVSCGLINQKLLNSVSDSFKTWKVKKDFRESAEHKSKEQEEYFRRISFERDELKEFSLASGEREKISEILNKQEVTEDIDLLASEGLELLESEQGLLTKLIKYRKSLENPKILETFKEIRVFLESSEVNLQEAASEILTLKSRLTLDPEELEQNRSRLTDIIRLERKYGKNDLELVEYYQHINSQLEKLSSGEFDLEHLKKAEAEAFEKYNKFASKLSKEREKAAKELSSKVELELKSLDMKKAKFLVDLEPGESSISGFDQVEFKLAANPGEPFRPISKVASGGELSRIVLILRTLLSMQSSPLLQVFDEIDTGVGGAVLQTIGEKLKKISKESQIILVTHASQIAALADRHLYVSKSSAGDRTSASAKILGSKERVQEVARMMAGKKVSSNFIGSAEELIALRSNE